MSTVPAPTGGPMGKHYVTRPCGHGYWAIPSKAAHEFEVKRTCGTCGTPYTVVVHTEPETADVTERPRP